MEAVHSTARPATQPKPRRRNPAASSIPAGFAVGGASPRRRRGRGGNGLNNSSEGAITLARSELLSSVEYATAGVYAKAVVLEPTDNFMPWLYVLYKGFDQMQWHSCSIVYKPAVGTTFAGSLVVGVDWNAEATKTDRNVVQACTPVMEAAAWQPLQMTLPSSRLQSRRFYIRSAEKATDRAPGVLLINLKTSESRATFVGDIWIHYKVTLYGPSA
nr:MAG: VP3 protein [Solemoviridae sp. 1]